MMLAICPFILIVCFTIIMMRHRHKKKKIRVRFVISLATKGKNIMSLLDTTGGYQLDQGLPGSRYGTGPFLINTYVNAGTTGTKDAAGGIDGLGTVDFGVAVADGSVAQTIVPFSSTNGSQTIRGITSRFAEMAATAPGNVIGYPTGKELGIYEIGEIYAVAAAS